MKRRHKLLTLFLASCAPLCAEARDFIDLSGDWQTNIGVCRLPGTTDESRLGAWSHPTDVTIQLTRLNPYVGQVYYEREVEIPMSMTGKRLTMIMERTKSTTLWIDGDSIGHIAQLYAPHVYELPELAPGRHSVRILVDNSNETVPESVRGSHAWTDATQTNWNGILGRFGIEATDKTYIRYVRTYPDLYRKGVLVKVGLNASPKKKRRPIVAELNFTCSIGGEVVRTYSDEVELAKGESEVTRFIHIGDSVKLWSEFHPDIYDLTVQVNHKLGSDEQHTTFGMRRFRTIGTQFEINDHYTFLRGTHDGCVFPLTGYAPTDVEEWRRMFRIAKEYGINHYRFHSYTPTEAAFIAADEEGIYLHTELPLWGTIDSTKTWQNEFLRHEAFTTLDFLGNHPSFVSLGLGNELWGDTTMMRQWLDDFRAIDDRHLYSMGSNNDLGWKGPKEGEDFYITCRVGAVPNDRVYKWGKELNEAGYGTHARTSFSFADADNGGILNWMRPGTRRDFSNVVRLCKTPIVSHETCQFQIYPDYKELGKYTGVLYPYNHEIFRDRLKENGLTDQIDDFHRASGKWAMECYKADMEYCLRTKFFGGYQLLDIKDYPGQGSALVGVLDAFMDSKGLITADEFRSFNSPVVPLAVMDSYCFTTIRDIEIDVVLSNYEENDYTTPVEWHLFGGNFDHSGSFDKVNVLQGYVGKVGRIRVTPHGFNKPRMLTLTLTTGKYSNSYKIWVYPSVYVFDDEVTLADQSGELVVSYALDARTIKALNSGKNVLLIANHYDIEKKSVGGLFTPDYWNYAMFKTISENNNRPVSPGTLGMLMDPEHNALINFPNEGHTDWQWWSIALNSRPLILDEMPHDYKPVIQTIDNVERNHKLGILMEFRVGKGKILVTTTNLREAGKCLEGQWYIHSLFRYARSKTMFNPQYDITIEDLRHLLYSESVSERDIQGVKNITDYKQK